MRNSIRNRCKQLAVLSLACGWVASTPAAAQQPFPVSSRAPATPNYQLNSVEIQLQRLKENSSPPVVTALAASLDGRFLAAAGDDHAIRIIDVKRGETVQTVMGHTDWIQSMCFVYPDAAPDADLSDAVSADSEAESPTPVLYSAGNDGKVLEWRYEYPVEFNELIQVPYAIRSISVSAEQGLMAIGGFADAVLLFDMHAGELRHKLQCDCGDQLCVRFSPDGTRVLCGGRDGGVTVWDTRSGKVLADYHQHSRRVATAAFSRDGSMVTSASEDRSVVRFDIGSQSVLRRRELGLSKMMSLCMLNETVVAVAGADNKIRLYDVPSDSIVGELEGHMGTVAEMIPCGEFLASGSFDTTVRIWDLETVDLNTMASENGASENGALGNGAVGNGPEGALMRGTVPVKHSPLKIDDELRIR